jgi:eukaryotic-like serine/threonine-protein kinase
LGLGPRLPAILKGDDQPEDAAEGLSLAVWCQQYKGRYAAASRFYAAAFAEQPRLTADLNAQRRYNAACCAAMAAAGQGTDAHLLPDKVAVMFRRWALGWLRDDLAAYAMLAERDNSAEGLAIRQRLAHWRRDPGLASVRDPQALDHLPENERAGWQALWRDVDGLAKRLGKQGEPTKGRKGPEAPKARPEGRSLPPSGATGR